MKQMGKSRVQKIVVATLIFFMTGMSMTANASRGTVSTSKLTARRLSISHMMRRLLFGPITSRCRQWFSFIMSPPRMRLKLCFFSSEFPLLLPSVIVFLQAPSSLHIGQSGGTLSAWPFSASLEDREEADSPGPDSPPLQALGVSLVYTEDAWDTRSVTRAVWDLWRAATAAAAGEDLSEGTRGTGLLPLLGVTSASGSIIALLDEATVFVGPAPTSAASRGLLDALGCNAHPSTSGWGSSAVSTGSAWTTS
mmetsp:Transcript_78663/g.177697  ORF Transcript_78663/g.177697 Transcript_78663/m.177697 type:complete len:252 (+) Transcript_78663:1460-2215(+)